MGEHVSMRTMFQALGLSADVATLLYDEEKIQFLTIMGEHDANDVCQLFKTIRNPDGDEDGHRVLSCVVKLFGQAASYCKMQTRVGRKPSPLDVCSCEKLEAAAAKMELEAKYRITDCVFLPLNCKSLKDHTFTTYLEK